ncbi:MAG: hypothetical protein QM503_01870 [Bacteroidota bacterium]
MKNLSILIIENHLLVIDSYKNIIDKINTEEDDIFINIDIANSFDIAIEFVENKNSINQHLIILMGISIPISSVRGMLCGEDFGNYINEFFPKIKLIISTSLTR